MCGRGRGENIKYYNPSWGVCVVFCACCYDVSGFALIFVVFFGRCHAQVSEAARKGEVRKNPNPLLDLGKSL